MSNYFEDRARKKKSDFSEEMFDKTKYYQKKFHFKVGSDPNQITHNNEADAFKHAFMSASLSRDYGNLIAQRLTDDHENGGTKRGQPGEESNMDLWNNKVGREIANEVKRDLKGEKGYTEKQIEDMVAVKIMERMKKGELITEPFKDKRKFEDCQKRGRVFTSDEVDKMNPKVYKENRYAILGQVCKSKYLPSDKEAKEAVLRGGDLG